MSRNHWSEESMTHVHIVSMLEYLSVATLILVQTCCFVLLEKTVFYNSAPLAWYFIVLKNMLLVKMIDYVCHFSNLSQYAVL